MFKIVIDLVNKSNHNRESSMECHFRLQKVTIARDTAAWTDDTLTMNLYFDSMHPSKLLPF